MAIYVLRAWRINHTLSSMALEWRAVELCRRAGMIIDDRRRPLETARQLFWRQSRLLNWARKTLRSSLCRLVGLKKSSNI
jgi:hypothetical protein